MEAIPDGKISAVGGSYDRVLDAQYVAEGYSCVAENGRYVVSITDDGIAKAVEASIKAGNDALKAALGDGSTTTLADVTEDDIKAIILSDKGAAFKTAIGGASAMLDKLDAGQAGSLSCEESRPEKTGGRAADELRHRLHSGARARAFRRSRRPSRRTRRMLKSRRLTRRRANWPPTATRRQPNRRRTWPKR